MTHDSGSDGDSRDCKADLPSDLRFIYILDSGGESGIRVDADNTIPSSYSQKRKAHDPYDGT